VNLTFQAYHLMIGIGLAMIVLTLTGIVGWWRGWLWTCRPLLWVLVFAVLLPQIGNQIGWMTAEVGRQPWIVWGLMRTEEGLSTVVGAGSIVISLTLFMLVYLLLFAVFIFMMNHKIHDGPEDVHSEEYSRFREAFMQATSRKGGR
jgi:cytochrome d ubiquinol oxidase subunit I